MVSTFAHQNAKPIGGSWDANYQVNVVIDNVTCNGSSILTAHLKQMSTDSHQTKIKKLLKISQGIA